ncbi:hypothetical protein BDZ45DRAFT_578983, partial [Acephala macrosclerotiorum]
QPWTTSTHPSPILGPLPVVLRLFGKFLAFINTIWVILTSILQFTNLYDNCWCSASVLGLGTEVGRFCLQVMRR